MKLLYHVVLLVACLAALTMAHIAPRAIRQGIKNLGSKSSTPMGFVHNFKNTMGLDKMAHSHRHAVRG